MATANSLRRGGTAGGASRFTRTNYPPVLGLTRAVSDPALEDTAAALRYTRPVVATGARVESTTGKRRQIAAARLGTFRALSNPFLRRSEEPT
jgi:hypothetical protein